MNKNIIVAPNSNLARLMIDGLREAGFQIEHQVTAILYNGDAANWKHKMMGHERINLFVAISPRDFLSAKAWPTFVKQVRQEYEIRTSRHGSMFSTWIEVYLP
jgi:hypothetical protein